LVEKRVTTITEILSAVKPESVTGLSSSTIESVACHPDGVKGPNCLFFCINEYLEYNKWQTWRSHLEALPELPLAGVVTPEKIEGLSVPQLITPHPRRALGDVARLMSGYPDLHLPVYGVTGTNGKTTTTRLLAHLLSETGMTCGSVGTLGIELKTAFSDPGTYTTPLAPDLYDDLSRMRQAGAKAVAIEVSSHGLALDRVEGIAFDGAVLTNVERDHLDFHGTLEAYAEAKKKLFTRVRKSGLCVLNKNSPYWEEFADAASAKVITYGGRGSRADVELVSSELYPSSSHFVLRMDGNQYAFVTHLVGGFQIENAMAAIALLWGKGLAPEDIASALRTFPSVCGRMERYFLPNGATAIVDYAHNPDGLKCVLENSRELCQGDLHVVFGCGGDRDKGKRPIMGGLASSLADVAWVTSDNPRTEDPGNIIADILTGCVRGSGALHTEPDRRVAIVQACEGAASNDVIVIAGKGHEDYQLVGFTKHPFSDQAVLKELGATQSLS
jgi:UDP-N-acetylmuramoyl-L-alanyl-D-glutamate--2,6-diaminopimelate ligase